MTQINPYLSFDGNCREAMQFYQRCLGGELLLQTVAETAIATLCSPAAQELIMHSMLVKGDWILMGSDMTGGKHLHTGNDVTLAVQCDSEIEIRDLYRKISEGAEVLEGLTKKPWGTLFGAITDRFGKHWIFNCDTTNSMNDQL